MNKLKKQIEYAKFTENSVVCLDIDYAERLLLELVEQYETPTLEEIIKEWENDGWYWEEDSLSISLTKSSRTITIYKDSKEYDCTRHNMWKVGTLSIKQHQLLTKTFKALGWEV